MTMAAFAPRAALQAVALVRDGDIVGTIEFDCFVREKHTMSAEPTEHAIEGTGQGRTDHVLQKPDTLVLDVIASNTPNRAPKTQVPGGVRATTSSEDVEVPAPLIPEPKLNPQNRGGSLVNGIVTSATPGLGPIDGLIKRTTIERVQVAGWSAPFDRRRDVWAELRRMKEAGEIITVVTSLQIYESMVLVEVDTECTVRNGRALEATLTLRRVTLVDSKLVKAPGVPKPAVSKGRKTTTPAPKPAAERASAVYKLTHRK